MLNNVFVMHIKYLITDKKVGCTHDNKVSTSAFEMYLVQVPPHF